MSDNAAVIEAPEPLAAVGQANKGFFDSMSASLKEATKPKEAPDPAETPKDTEKPEKPATAVPEGQKPPVSTQDKKSELKKATEIKAGEQKPTEKLPEEKKPEKLRLSSLPQEDQDFLRASDVRKVKTLEELRTAKTELETKSKEMAQELETLRAQAKDLPAQAEGLRREVEDLRKERDRLEGVTTAYSVRETSEYIKAVKEPWQRGVIDVVNAILEKFPTFDAETAYESIKSGDTASLSDVTRKLNDMDKHRIVLAFDRAQELKLKDAEYSEKGKAVLEEINQRKTQSERQAIETARQQVKSQFGPIDEQINQRFPFLKDPGENKPLAEAIDLARKARENFDFTTLQPKDQAMVANAATLAPLIVAVQQEQIQGLQKQLNDAGAEHDKEVEELKAKITQLEERVGAHNGERQATAPGAGRDASGKFTGKVDVNSEFSRLMKGTR